MKNKTLGAIGIAFIGLLILGYVYLLYKVLTIFGLWTLVWTGIVSIFSGSALMLLAASKKIEGDKIRYNPKEWPKLLSFLVSLSIGYYLFTLLDKEALSEVDYYFALAYLATLTLLPILIGLFKLIRDRNDELIITPNTISYRDNSRFGEVELSKVYKGESYDEGYRLHLKDNTTFDIPFKKMGFSSLDKSSAIKGILDALGNEKNESDLNEPSIEEQKSPDAGH